MKFNLPNHKYFFANRSQLLHKFVKSLKSLYQDDIFGYDIISTELNKKKLKFIQKNYLPYSIKLNSNKNYVIFINYARKSHILLNEKLISRNKNQIILFLENEIDNGIYIYEIK